MFIFKWFCCAFEAKRKYAKPSNFLNTAFYEGKESDLKDVRILLVLLHYIQPAQSVRKGKRPNPTTNYSTSLFHIKFESYNDVFSISWLSQEPLEGDNNLLHSDGCVEETEERRRRHFVCGFRDLRCFAIAHFRRGENLANVRCVFILYPTKRDEEKL